MTQGTAGRSIGVLAGSRSSSTVPDSLRTLAARMFDCVKVAAAGLSSNLIPQGVVMKAMPLPKDGVRELRKACGELRRRLTAGDPARVEELLIHYPRLAESEEAVLELILAEVSARNEMGQRPSLKEWQERFPRLLPRMEEAAEFQSVRLGDADLARLVGGRGTPRHPAGPDRGEPTQDRQLSDPGGGRPGRDGGRLQARQPNLSRSVAIKMILAGEHAGPRERARLRIEAEAAAQIVHPNVVQVFEIGEHEGLPFVVLEYVSGGNLTRMLRGMPQAFRWSARLIEILARAIHVAHERGIVHRDLNPSNILMSHDGTPKISDFGLAKILVEDIGVSIHGVLLGTPSYMAPEQVTGEARDIGPATDIYALGAILYEMLTGAAPFRGLTPMETLCQVMEADVVPPSRLRHGVPEDLETICLKCLDRDPARRYASAEGLADDLKRYQENQPIQAVRASRLRQVRQWARRQPLAAGLLSLSTLLFLTLLVVVGGFNLHLSAKNRQLEQQISQTQVAQNVTSVSRAVRRQDDRLYHRQWYGAQLFRVKHTIEAGELDLARELLDEIDKELNENDSRGFEWHYLERLLQRAVRPLGEPETAAQRDGRVARSRGVGDR